MDQATIKSRVRPAWVGQGIVFSGNWEPLAFRRRSGHARVDETASYEREHREELVQKLAAAGCTMILTHFAKGGGPIAEAAEVERTRALAVLCHRHGMRLGAYIRFDTLSSETLFLERPEATEWRRVAADGSFPRYGNQLFRYLACPSSEEYLQFVEGRVRAAVVEVGADLVHFDGFETGRGDRACTCPRCRAGFTRFLRGKYGSQLDLAEERFGHRNLERIEAPTWHPASVPTSAQAVINDPAVQEWIEYRCWLLSRIQRRLSDYIGQLNPEVAVEVNTLIPMTTNHYFLNGLDFEQFAGCNDAIWTEGTHDPGILADGRLSSRIGEFKLGYALENAVFTYIRGTTPRQVGLSFAQSLAFNHGCIGHIGGGLPPEEPFWEVKRRWISFFREHFTYFDPRQTRSAAEVALWRPRNSLAYNSEGPWRSTMLWEQTLIQSHIPFDIVLDRNLAHLDHYRVIILPDAECLSDEQVTILTRFVERGGSVVASEESGYFDQWRRRRADTALRSLLGADARSPRVWHGTPQWPSALPAWDDESPPSRPVRRELSKGARIAYFPVLELPPIAPRDGAEPKVADFRWRLPANASGMSDAITWVGEPLSLRVEAPPALACEHLRQSDREMIHLVNFDLKQSADVRLRLHLRQSQLVERVRLLQLDIPPHLLTFQLQEKSDARWITLDVRVDIYALVLIELRNADASTATVARRGEYGEGIR